MERIAIYGYSRDGKMATIAAAYDSRISALIAGSTGVGGLLPWRLSGERGGGEGIESTTRMFPDWFIPELRFFSGREDVLPVDANLFLALIAPRAVLIQWGYNDEVSNGWAQEQAYASALEVYRRYSAGQKLECSPSPVSTAPTICRPVWISLISNSAGAVPGGRTVWFSPGIGKSGGKGMQRISI